jgi:hypothetical protein
MAKNPCPAANQTTITSPTGSLWVIYCGVDWPEGSSGANGNGIVHDLDIQTVYTLRSCIEKCVKHNADIEIAESPCAAVEYQANLTSAFGGRQGGNCFLKDRVGTYSPASFGGMAAGLVGG